MSELSELLRSRFPDYTFEDALEPTMVVPADAFVQTMRTLRDEPELQLDLLVDETAADYPPDRIRLTCHLVSLQHHHRMCVHVDLERARPEVDSLVPLWQAADFLEREVYDMYGVTFRGHPNLVRIMMADDFEGWPLRKDFSSPELIPLPER